MEDLTLVVYSHSDYSDLWVPCYERINKHYKLPKKAIIVDKLFDNHFNGFEPHYYDDSMAYTKRLEKTLSEIDSKYVLFLHEDMFLYDDVDIKTIQSNIEFMNNNPDYKFTRLIKSGINSNIKLSDKIYGMNDRDMRFSITPTIWIRETLLNLSSSLPSLNIWEFEMVGDSYVKAKGIAGLYNYEGEPKRGMNHFDSKVFPHMCSAVFKGKWNMEYNKELKELFDEFNIDKEVRGTIF